MNWPLPQDFNEAVQNPPTAFADPDLKGGQPVVGAQGLPLPRSGNFADVYQMRGPGGRDWAVKCFTRPVFGLDDRYAKVGEALNRVNLPFGIGFTFLSEGIRVRGEWRPAVKMEWVEGLLLNQVVRENAGRPMVLSALVQMWVKLCRRLREVGIAHADLQHGNVILVPGSRSGTFGLKLIDYDGMYVPALANRPSGEAGHPNYQHPTRVAGRVYSPDLDRFPHLVIVTALKALECCGPALWDRYDTGDNLLFVEDDFRTPASSRLMRSLWDSGHPAVQALVGQLAIACGKPIPQTPWLDQIAPDGVLSPLDDETARAAAAALGAPVQVAVPAEVPAAPEPAAAANVFAGLDLDDEPAPAPIRSQKAAEKPTARKPVRKAELAAEGKKFPVLPVAIAGGVLLLVGMIAGAVLIFGGKKPDDTTQSGGWGPGNPDRGKPPQNPRVDDPGKQDLDPPPPKIIDPPAGITSGPVEQRLRWEAKAEQLQQGATISFDREGSAVVLGGYVHQGVLAFDVRTGAPLPAFKTHNPRAVDANSVLPLDGKAIGGYSPSERTIYGWRLDDGEAIANHLIPDLPFPADRGNPWVWFAPNLKAVVVARPTIGFGKDATPGPLRVFVNGPDWKPVVSIDWLFSWAHFTADSSRVLVSESSGRTRWFKLPSGEVDGEWVFGDKDPKVPAGDRSVAISDDGRVILHAGVNGPRGGVFLLDGRNGKVLRWFGGSYSGINASVSADGRVVALVRGDDPPGGFTVDVIDVESGNVTCRVPVPEGGGNPVAAARLSPDGKTVAVFLPREGRLAVYDVAAGRPAGPKPKSPDTPSASVDVKPRWTAKADLKTGFGFMAFDREGRALALANSTRPRIVAFEARDGTPLPGFAEHTAAVRELIPMDQGRIASYCYDPKEGITVWDVRTGKSAHWIPMPGLPWVIGPSGQREIGDLSVALSPNERYIAAGVAGKPRMADGQLVLVPGAFRILDVASKKPLVSTEWTGGRVVFTADSSRALLAEHGGRFRWFKLPDGEPDGEWKYPQVPAPDRANWPIETSDDGRVILYHGRVPGKPEGMYAIDGRTGKVIREFGGRYVARVGSISGDGRLVALWRTDLPPDEPLIDLFDVDTGLAARLKVPQVVLGASVALAFSRDGRGLAIWAGETVSVMDITRTAPGGPKPKDPPPSPPKPREVVELNPRWTAPTGGRGTAELCVDPEADLVLLSTGFDPTFAALDLRTGAPRAGFEGLKKTGVSGIFPLERGRVATYTRDDTEVRFWSARTGEPIPGRHPVPDIPPGAGNATSRLVELSPNGRYLANTRNGSPNGRNPDVPFRLLNTSTGKNILTFDWNGGSVHFTADSSRVLVVEYTGRCRWFKLPSGEPDGEWDFGQPPPGRAHVVTGMSGNGRVLGYVGPGKKGADAQGPYLVDGQTGGFTRQFGKEYFYTSRVSVSGDGRLAAVMRSPDGNDSVIDVIDVATGAPVARASVTTNRNVPTFVLSSDGQSLAIHDSNTRKVYLYDLSRLGP